jgi:hypothetical protein
LVALIPWGLPDPGVGVPRDLFGRGTDFSSREGYAIEVAGETVRVAANRITRERSQLSEYQTQPVLAEIDLRSGSVREVALAPEQPGVISSRFQFISGRDGTNVVLLREHPGPTIRSDAYRVRVTDGEARSWNLTRTPRRVFAPIWVTDRLLWLSEQPLNNSYRLIVRGDAGAAIVRALGLELHGDPWESAVAALLAVPVAAILAFVRVFAGSLPLLLVLALTLWTTYRFAPAAVASHPERFMGLVASAGVLLVGVAPLSLFGITAMLPARLVTGTVAVSVCLLVRSRRSDPLTGPNEALAYVALALVLVQALEGYSVLGSELGQANLLPMSL